MSTNYEAIVQPEGRVLIPSELRRALGMTPGSHVVLRQSGDSVILTPRAAIKQHLHQLFAGLPGSMADELIEERHADAAREMKS